MAVVVEQLGEREVVARPDLRPGLHRDAEAGAAGLAAVDRDDERVAAARLVVVVGVRAADEYPILDLDRMQLAAPDSDERERRRSGCVRRDRELAVRAPLGSPELQLGRQELPLPRLRSDGEAEASLVVAPLEPVAARLLHVGVARRKIVGGLSTS